MNEEIADWYWDRRDTIKTIAVKTYEEGGQDDTE